MNRGFWEGGMTLGYLIRCLESLPSDMEVEQGFDEGHSYRGYYECLAFEPAGKTTVGDLLATVRKELGVVHQGYKGGDFLMDESTEVFIANWGCLGKPLTPKRLRKRIGVCKHCAPFPA